MKLQSMTSAMLASSLLLAGLTSGPAFADDGQRLVRSVSSPPGIEENPEPEGEHAFISFMNFHVPAQLAEGTLTEIEYFNIDDALVKTELKAKPLINVYVFGPVIGFEDFSQSGFPGHGRRDAFGAVSLDDGETWKVTNLSNSADKSSFTIADPIPDPGAPQPEFEVTSDTPIVTEATWVQQGQGKLTVSGTDAESQAVVEIRNAITHEVLGDVKAKKNGTFTFKDNKTNPTEVPCTVQASDTDGELW
ncbi:MAG: hypothetical protein U9P00_02460, partial [Pseudomonadota bacterium]|nr:hypothetical protein [Pseudomonadota bacterium]